jgi:hypothetical protein
MEKIIGVARWLREVIIEPPTDPSERPHVVQHIFRVTPPMKWTESAVYRRGKLLKDSRRTSWMRRFRFDRRTGREIKPGDMFTMKPDPIFSYGDRHHETSFVLVSASDLRTYMNAANLKMQKLMKERGDKEGERLFQRQDHFEVETYIFPCDKFGKWKNSSELEGSQRGTLDHRVALQDAGYVVIGMPRKLLMLAEFAEPAATIATVGDMTITIGPPELANDTAEEHTS